MTDTIPQKIAETIARELGVREQQVDATIKLLDEGSTVPFIAPTIALLLAINIFPLIWTIRLSFTNFRANQPNAPVVP